MLFNSLDFAVFLPIVFILYWLIPAKNNQFRNALLVIASAVFYGWWDWRFLGLIFFSISVDYFVGLRIAEEKLLFKRKLFLWISIGTNVGLLAVFKYYNFFAANFVAAFSFLGQEIEPGMLHIILPVGISFYTFQTLSYSIDIYRKKAEPTNNFIAFAAFVSFFPQLVAGPIERASNFLPQFLTKKTFQYPFAISGMRLILWGFFQKIAIGDRAGLFADYIFNRPDHYSGSTLLLGAVLFAFQIYGDFAGYSNIAIGTARLFGFRLQTNFAFPYFSRNMAEFWRRWHISLSTWFRDYVYIPLGGSKVSFWKQARNVLIVFILSGFWHGAQWTFVFWGLLHGLLYLSYLSINAPKTSAQIIAYHSHFPSFKAFLSMCTTFLLVVLGWIFFRAENIATAFAILNEIGSRSFFSFPQIFPTSTLMILTFFVILEWIGRREVTAIDYIRKNLSRPYRILFYYLLLFLILQSAGHEQPFIYFQF